MPVPVPRPQPERAHPRRRRSVAERGRANRAAHLVYQELRDDIVSMRREPGQPISEKEIALARGISRTPVREALLRLADEQLVEIFPQSGTFVSRIPIKVLPEAILVRRALEELTARLAAERASPEHVALLHETVERQRAMSERGDRNGFHEADEAFHAVIAEAAGHPGIWQLIQQVKVQVDRYRRLTLPVPGRMSQVLDEHAAVVEAVESHHAERAAAAMAAHLEALSASIADVRELNPNYFIDGAELLLP